MAFVCQCAYTPSFIHAAPKFNDNLFLYESEGYSLLFPLFLLSPRIIMPCRCSSTMTKDHVLVIFHGTKWPLCANVPLSPHSPKLTSVLRLYDVVKAVEKLYHCIVCLGMAVNKP